MKLRLIFRSSVADAEGKHADTVYATDIVELPEGSNAMRLPSADRWKPEVIGCEWIQETVEEDLPF